MGVMVAVFRGVFVGVSVGLFVGQNDEARQASVNKIYPQRGVNLIEAVSFAAPLSGPSAGTTPLPAVVMNGKSSSHCDGSPPSPEKRTSFTMSLTCISRNRPG